MLVSEALELIKEQAGVKDQYALASVIGVSQGTISNYMKEKSYPTLEIAAGIYKEYGHQCQPFTEWALADYNEKYGG